MDTLKLRVAANSVYLAAPASVARDLSDMLTLSANTIDTMQVQNAKLADIVRALTAELAKKEKELEDIWYDDKGEREIDKLASREEMEYHEDKENERKQR